MQKKIIKKFFYSHMFDGVHPDCYLRERWFSVVCRSIRNDLSRDLLLPMLSSFHSEDDDSEESQEVSAVQTDTWDFKGSSLL